MKIAVTHPKPGDLCLGWRIRSVRASLPPRKPDGRPWDGLGDRYPDPKATIHVEVPKGVQNVAPILQGRRFVRGRFPVQQDRNVACWSNDNVLVDSYFQTSITVVDADLAEDDLALAAYLSFPRAPTPVADPIVIEQDGTRVEIGAECAMVRPFGELGGLAALAGKAALALVSERKRQDLGRELHEKKVEEHRRVDERHAWAARAAQAMKVIADQDSGSALARGIIGAIHPTGNEPRLAAADPSPDGDDLVVVIVVHWKGGFLGTKYTTTVKWRAAEMGTRSVDIVSDNAQVAISKAGQQRLSKYFEETVYRQVLTKMRE